MSNFLYCKHPQDAPLPAPKFSENEGDDVTGLVKDATDVSALKTAAGRQTWFKKEVNRKRSVVGPDVSIIRLLNPLTNA